MRGAGDMAIGASDLGTLNKYLMRERKQGVERKVLPNQAGPVGARGAASCLPDMVFTSLSPNPPTRPPPSPTHRSLSPALVDW